MVFSDASMNPNGNEFVNFTVFYWSCCLCGSCVRIEKNNKFLLPNMSLFSFITTVWTFMLTSPGCFPSVVCLCDLDRGFNQLSDLLTLQLGFWLQKHWGGGGCEVSHGVVVDGCRRGSTGVESVFPVLFPQKIPYWVSSGENPDCQSHRATVTDVPVI